MRDDSARPTESDSFITYLTLAQTSGLWPLPRVAKRMHNSGVGPEQRAMESRWSFDKIGEQKLMREGDTPVRVPDLSTEPMNAGETSTFHWSSSAYKEASGEAALARCQVLESDPRYSNSGTIVPVHMYKGPVVVVEVDVPHREG